MLDEDDGDAQPTDPAEQREQLLLLVVIEAGRRLVEEQHLWLARQRTSDLDSTLLAVRQVAHLRRAVRPDPHEVEPLVGLVRGQLFRAAVARGAQDGVKGVLPQSDMGAGAHVVQDRELSEEAEVLEGTGDALGRDVRRATTGDVVTLEGHLPGLRLVEPGDAVEGTRLARPVGTDDREHLPLAYLEGQPVHGLHTTEGDGEPLDVEHHSAHRATSSVVESALRRPSLSESPPLSRPKRDFFTACSVGV